MVMYRLIFAELSFSRPFGINSALNPGSIEKTYTDQVSHHSSALRSRLSRIQTKSFKIYSTFQLKIPQWQLKLNTPNPSGKKNFSKTKYNLKILATLVALQIDLEG